MGVTRQMENFNFYAPTKMLFGRGKVAELPQEMKPFGSRVLLVYGGGSIKKNGIYDTVINLLRGEGFELFELGGVTPNPKIEAVRCGVSLAWENHVDMVLAVGGGSTVDCGKAIAAGACHEGDPWELVKDAGKIQAALPIFTVLTMSATGSEMNETAVISNLEAKEKQGVHSGYLYPRVSVLDPTYLYTLPAGQTAAGVADIMSHIFEGYFKRTEDAYVQDKFAEGILKTCIKWGPVALTEPENYSARANIMWAGTLAHNDVCGVGREQDWASHNLEHELSAFYDCAHGAGLAVMFPAWMTYVMHHDVDRFAQFAVRVWGCEMNFEDPEETAKEGIARTKAFFRSVGMPTSFAELGAKEEDIPKLLETLQIEGRTEGFFVKLGPKECEEVYRLACR